ncbi:hypothetical protein MKZ38_001897 [Zalerion maritima]|uniref:Uncharacterized protein n=1 Tax=Zalerion maritima TaxID=339359 RepID=A0AAD5WRN0_9PEZI|nr:hypothetical protein MKZ38_001897 [Zalerion maritima]
MVLPRYRASTILHLVAAVALLSSSSYHQCHASPAPTKTADPVPVEVREAGSAEAAIPTDFLLAKRVEDYQIAGYTRLGSKKNLVALLANRSALAIFPPPPPPPPTLPAPLFDFFSLSLSLSLSLSSPFPYQSQAVHDQANPSCPPPSPSAATTCSYGCATGKSYTTTGTLGCCQNAESVCNPYVECIERTRLVDRLGKTWSCISTAVCATAHVAEYLDVAPDHVYIQCYSTPEPQTIYRHHYSRLETESSATAAGGGAGAEETKEVEVGEEEAQAVRTDGAESGGDGDGKEDAGGDGTDGSADGDASGGEGGGGLTREEKIALGCGISIPMAGLILAWLTYRQAKKGSSTSSSSSSSADGGEEGPKSGFVFKIFRNSPGSGTVFGRSNKKPKKKMDGVLGTRMGMGASGGGGRGRGGRGGGGGKYTELEDTEVVYSGDEGKRYSNWDPGHVGSPGGGIITDGGMEGMQPASSGDEIGFRM